jgi:NADH-quinone oxidoreductase subunit M
MPLLTWFTLVLLLAGIGIPGTNGFIAEWLMLLGAFEHHAGLGLAMLLAFVLSAGYSLGYFQTAFLGPTTRIPVQQAGDLRPRELALLGTLTAAVLALGLCPRLITTATEASAIAWVKQVGGRPAQQPSLFAGLGRDTP